MKCIGSIVLTALLIGGVAFSDSAVGKQLTSDGRSVIVFRGSSVDRVSFDKEPTSSESEKGTVAVESGVVVVRGITAPRKRDNSREYTDILSRWTIFGGERLWFVDNYTGNIVVCYLRNTSYVGQRVVQCD